MKKHKGQCNTTMEGGIAKPPSGSKGTYGHNPYGPFGQEKSRGAFDEKFFDYPENKTGKSQGRPDTTMESTLQNPKIK